MKIGILTFHRAHNYGAVLQCYALQEVLKHMGHDVWVIDYRQPWTEGVYSVFDPWIFTRQYPRLKNKIKFVLNLWKRIGVVKKKTRIFETFTKKYLNLTQPCDCHIPEDYDVYVIGSDQLWGLKCLGMQFDDVYLGNFTHKSSSKIIGYAISTNKFSIDKLISEHRLSATLLNFDAISFRESQVAEYVEKCTGMECDVAIDPTLLTTSEIWDDLVCGNWNERTYVLIYQVRFTKNSTKRLYENAKRIANRYGDCEIIDLSSCKYSVADFVSAFKFAKYVLTTSFHATVFSLIFKTPVVSFCLNDGVDVRYSNLLKSLGADSLLCDINSNFYPTNVDFETVEKSLLKLREHSYFFLRKSFV